MLNYFNVQTGCLPLLSYKDVKTTILMLKIKKNRLRRNIQNFKTDFRKLFLREAIKY